MEESSFKDSNIALCITFLVGAFCLAIAFLSGRLWKHQGSDKDKTITNGNSVESDETIFHDKRGNKSKNKKKPVPDRRQRDLKAVFSHRWLLTSLKGHSGKILDMDFSSNGKYLASCADDRSLIIWTTKDFTDRDHRFVRANVDFDHAKKIKWSPDSKAFIIAQGNGNALEVFKLGKKEDGTMGKIQSVMTFPKKHGQDIIGIGIASSGKFIMTASLDTTIIIWDLKGDILATIDNHQMTTYHASVSTCSRFVASSGFTPDVKIWEVVFSKTGEFKEVVRAFELKGHSAGVVHFSFNDDSSRMATVSKDGTWKLWDTKIQYQNGQDPYLLMTFNLPYSGANLITLSSDGRAAAVAAGSNLTVYSTVTEEEVERIEDIHSDEIVAIAFDTSNKYIVTAGSKQIRVFHNIVGYQATIRDLEEKKRKAPSQSVKERIQQQISDAKTALKSIQSSQ